MEIGKTLYVVERKNWRVWLENNFTTENDVWLLYPKKVFGKPRISYNDAVEEALCFGWIDSTVKSYDEQTTAQRFSKRNSKSSFSQANKERLRWLAKEKMLHSSVQDSAKQVLSEKFIFSPDILKAIKSDKIAWSNYQNLSDGYKRIRIAYINVARENPQEFKKRLDNFIKKTSQNKLIKGFGGIEKHY